MVKRHSSHAFSPMDKITNAEPAQVTFSANDLARR
jgi:hypothetical protein